ncbi:MAG: hypothetical protein KDD82_17950 [Planctomycetes bacterium]|nr:hypothetical protein [Planctomycetota bacterium]
MLVLASGALRAEEEPASQGERLVQRLSKVLSQPVSSIGGQAEVHYPLVAAHELKDFKVGGFDLVDFHQESSLELGAGSRGTGSMLHKVKLEGDFEVEFDMWVKHNTPSASVAILLSKKVAVLWGQSLVKVKGFRQYDRRGRAADPGLFRENRPVHVKIACVGNTVTVTANQEQVSRFEFTKNELKDARFGIVAHNVRFVFSNLRIRVGTQPEPVSVESSEG